MATRLTDLIDLVIKPKCGLLELLHPSFKLGRYATDLYLLLSDPKPAIDLSQDTRFDSPVWKLSMKHFTAPFKAHGCLVDHSSLVYQEKHLICGNIHNRYLCKLLHTRLTLSEVLSMKPVKFLFRHFKDLSYNTHR